MIEYDELSLILERYGIDAKTVINNNANVLIKGEYNDIETTIKYLVEELNISPKNIEKAPSIMYLNVSAIKRNVKYLKKQNITFSNIETCLHVLSTKPEKLEETFNYIKDNYGIEYINRTTTILSVDIERIKEIEKLNLDKKIVISAAYSNLKVNEISKVIKVCKENNIEITGTVFRQPAEEIERIIKVCKENNIEITGSVFNKSAEEIEKIIKVCKENNIEITGTVFLKSAEEIEKIAKVCRENNIEITGSVFNKSAEEIEKIIKVCKENNIEITGSVFRQPPEEIERIIKVCKENNIEITGSVFLKSAEEIEKIIKVCRENNITITGSIFFKTSKKLIESIDFIKNNYDLSYLTSLIVIKDVKYLKEVFPYLEEMGVLEVVKKSASILSLSLEEIKERKEFIESINEPLVLDNGRFNSIFGMSRKRYLKKVNDILSSNRQM